MVVIGSLSAGNSTTIIVVSQKTKCNDSRSSRMRATMAKKNTKTWGERLKEIRTKAGVSQRTLGVKAGIDQFAASARMNRYEKGIHEPDSRMAKKIAGALGVPAALLHAEADDLAELIETYDKLPKTKRRQALMMLKALVME